MLTAIRSRFKAEVADAQSVPTQYDGDRQFTPPEDARWARWTVLPGESQMVELAGKNYRTRGVAIAQVFVPLDRGVQPALALADQIKTAFRSVEQGGVHFRTPSIANAGRDEQWLRVNVTCPWYADDVA